MPDTTERPHGSANARSPLTEIAWLFLRLGTTAFGGPAAHIAMMQEEVVVRRAWLSTDEFLDLLGATNLIPGPNSTELAIHIGHRRGGIPGLLVAGTCFIVPAAAITLGFACFYVRFGSVPNLTYALAGIKPVIVAVIGQALWTLGRSALKTRPLLAIGAIATCGAAFGLDELVVLAGSGVLAVVAAKANGADHGGGGKSSANAAVVGFSTGLFGAASLPSAVAPSSSALFLAFAKIGSVLFGSGYVLLAFLRDDLVVHRHWLTEGQLVDAVAVGQLTPGPVFTTATFVGYLIHGLPGAGAATLGIFLPAFVFVAASGPLVPRLRRSKTAGAFLDGINVASLGLMAVVTAQLARVAVTDFLSVGITAIAAVLLVRWKVNSVWLILGGAAIGVAKALAF